MHAAVEPACGRGQRATQQKVNEQMQRFLVLFDNDAEDRSELDVYQIGKYLQRSTT